jgi:hypothetical protein
LKSDILSEKIGGAVLHSQRPGTSRWIFVERRSVEFKFWHESFIFFLTMETWTMDAIITDYRYDCLSEKVKVGPGQ